MDQDRDIYTSPTPKAEQQPLADVDVVPRQVRRRNIRRGIGFLVFLVALSGIAFWLFGFYEEWGERADLEDLPDEAFIPPDRSAPAAPFTRPALDNWEAIGAAAPADIDPTVVAAAVEDLRAAQQYLQDGDLQGAEAATLSALDRWPHMPAALSTMGYITIQQGQFDRAIRHLNAAIDQDPMAAHAYNTLATAHMQRGEIERANELLQMALTIDPENPHIHLNLGMLYLITSQHDLAADYFARALESMPERHTLRNNYGVTLFRLGRYDDARAVFMQLIEAVPQESTWYFNMAATYVEQNDFDAAMEWVKRGAEYCTAAQFYRHTASGSFLPLRQQPAFIDFKEQVFPDVPLPI
jgi:Tfp pilus assembly protein PilF